MRRSFVVSSRLHRLSLFAVLVVVPRPAILQAVPHTPPASPCHKAVLQGELTAGEPFIHLLFNDLRVWFQPIASGWILRVIPVAASPGIPDYAQVATPPYNSVSPLSLSTDFAFRAQDAIGWNPRRFHLATSPAQFAGLLDLYRQILAQNSTRQPAAEARLSSLLAQTAEAKLTIIDSRLVPGMADQWRMAGAVSSAFESTAHTFADAPGGKPSPLGKLLWVRFKLELDLPAGSAPASGVVSLPYPCGSL